MNVDLSVRLGPVVLKNPILTASGLWGYGLDYVDLVDPADLGAVVTKTLTIEPRLGNPQPRMRELEHGVLNSIGLENIGLSAFIRTKLGELTRRKVDVVVSIAAREESEFAQMIDELTPHEGWLGVELNLSCPNVARGGLDFGRDPECIERIVRSAKEALPEGKCLLVKLTPSSTEIGALAAAGERGGADAISCINAAVGLEVDLERRRPVFARGTAGYSGPAILPIALAKVWEVSHAVRIPVVGIGGISSLEDVLAFLVVGASAVQVGTALLAQPDLANSFVHQLPIELERRGMASPGDMVADELRT
ncbi:MAG: dihydroorotate dehydrogenase [Acidimicrobiia bacterium]|nr:dihydroorotate dehydrogenase [Acidimicrobiia bacterium]